MPDTSEYSELSVTPRAGLYLFGLVALASSLRLVMLAAGDRAVTSAHFVWLAVCVIAATGSAACAVVVALKPTEAEWRGGD